MADLSFTERNQLERLLGMGSGYVLDFSNRTFQEFVADVARKNIDDPKYNYASCSKANRLRHFWKVEPNHIVGALLHALVDYAATIDNINPSLVPEGRRIAARLLASAPVQELDAIQPLNSDRTFEALARAVRGAIEDNEPEKGLDRLHTFVVRYVRTLCQKHGITAHRDKPLHSIFGEYVKRLRIQGLLQSEMTARILKSSISTLEAFNHVRNDQSFAHDNPVLNYDESLLIYNHVCASVRFLESLESSDHRPQPEIRTAHVSQDVPF
jgi:Abortive infection C-terminus